MIGLLTLERVGSIYRVLNIRAFGFITKGFVE
jgi:hypothetical protein